MPSTKDRVPAHTSEHIRTTGNGTSCIEGVIALK